MKAKEKDSESYILIVEDSLEDFEITARSLHQVGFPRAIRHFQDGDQVLDFLFSESLSSYPSMILLDLNLLGTDGLQVLKRIKASSILRSIPVLMLTTSNSKKDVSLCYSEGANCYIQKPMEFQELVNIAKSLKEFWFERSLLPV